MTEINHRFVDTNGIRMHIAEQGTGPLVILCHGFPECWYSWRHQLPALAEAGYHVVAPDQRGFGRTDRPEPIDAYNILQLTGDIVGLVHALGEEQELPPRATGIAKRLINQGYHLTLRESQNLEIDAQAELLNSPDFREAVDSYLEKRPPRFIGE